MTAVIGSQCFVSWVKVVVAHCNALSRWVVVSKPNKGRDQCIGRRVMPPRSHRDELDLAEARQGRIAKLFQPVGDQPRRMSRNAQPGLQRRPYARESAARAGQIP